MNEIVLRGSLDPAPAIGVDLTVNSYAPGVPVPIWVLSDATQ
ncbi:hypothetical protein [Streptosporangium sp. CA-115845]